jgi:hypothetical protein
MRNTIQLFFSWLFNPYHAANNSMKILSVASIGIAAALSLGSTLMFAEPSRADASGFVCGINKRGEMATYARMDDGLVPVIRWKRETFSGSGYTPIVRCLDVSARFDAANRQGRLQSLWYGKVNNQTTICALSDGEERCNSSNVLLTLEPRENAKAILADLMDAGNRASGPITRGNKVSPVNLNNYLKSANREVGVTPAKR